MRPNVTNCKNAIAFILTFWLTASCLAQAPTNVDPTKSPINVNLPRTPESAAFERYGNIPVNELTGTPNIAIPIYTLKSRFMEVPISLAYDASGVKVNQEASWVGLGFNLSIGGRITVETRGCIDFDVNTTNLFSPTELKSGMQALFTRLGNSNSSSILTFANTYFNSTPSGYVDDWGAINAMAQFGVGEPDIFHANFMGHSIDFYFDIITGDMKFLGEKSTFNIAFSKDNYGRVTDWTITDNDGLVYRFNQRETTKLVIPPVGGIYGNTSTTAWELTSITHPGGDQISFSYTNYGNSYPAFYRRGSLSWPQQLPGWNASNDADVQDTVIQQPQYLTHMESNEASVDFILSDRVDVKGAGTKRLDEIRITDKFSNTVKKKVLFGFDYFIGSLDNCHAGLAEPERSYYNKRLRLSTLTFTDSLLQPPYRFYYNDYAPDKYSSGQDHWGYYSGGGSTYFGYCSPKNLIPRVGEGNNLGYTELANIGESRDCNPNSLSVMSLDSMVYPTGGSTKFIYEPHVSQKTTPHMSPLPPVNGVSDISLWYDVNTITGGGQRIKTIRNYSMGKLAGSTEYDYRDGVYFGAIKYNTSAYKFTPCPVQPGSGFVDVLSNNGAVNDNDFLVGYGSVRTTQKNEKGESTGLIWKQFKINTPWYATNNNGGLGFDVLPLQPADGTVCDVHGNCTTFHNSLLYLAPPYTNFAPTPAKGLSGKLVAELYYDANTLKRSINYYYSLGEYTENFYSVKAIDNRIGGADAGDGGCGGGGHEHESGGAARFTLFVSPAKAYYTKTDSIVETNYEGSNVLKQTKAYTYDAKYQVQSESVHNSDKTQTVVSYNHPYDFPAVSVLQSMTAKHILTPVIETSISKGGTPVSLARNNYFSPYPNLYMPQSLQVQIAGNPIETRRQFNAFDTYGNLLEQQKTSDVKECYLWGYNAQYPVAKITGADYATVAANVSQAVLNAPTSDLQLRTYLQTNVRQLLPNAMVTTYTYSPLVGITSETDPSGKTSYYEYDALGRLLRIRDMDNNIVKAFSYKFKENYTYPFKSVVQSQYFARTCSLPGWEGGLTYVVPAGAYGSYTSQTEADNLAIADLNANGPIAATQQTCRAVYTYTTASGFGTVNSHFEVNEAGHVIFYLAINATSGVAYGKIGTISGVAFYPSVARIVNVSSGSSWSGICTIYPSGDVYIAGPNIGSSVISFSGTYELY